MSLTRIGRGSTHVESLLPLPWSSSGAASTALFLANLDPHVEHDRFRVLALDALRHAVASARLFLEQEPGFRIHLAGLSSLPLLLYALVEVCQDLARLG